MMHNIKRLLTTLDTNEFPELLTEQLIRKLELKVAQHELKQRRITAERNQKERILFQLLEQGQKTEHQNAEISITVQEAAKLVE